MDGIPTHCSSRAWVIFALPICLLSGCESPRRPVDLAVPPVAQHVIVTELPVASRPHIVIAERRTHEHHLGRGLVEADTSFAAFMTETLANCYPDYLFREEDAVVSTASDEGPRLQVEVVKAYITNRKEATEVVLAVRCYEPDTEAPPRVFRAQEVSLLLFGGEHAYRQIFQKCVEQVWRKIEVHYAAILTPWHQVSAAESSTREPVRAASKMASIIRISRRPIVPGTIEGRSSRMALAMWSIWCAC